MINDLVSELALLEEIDSIALGGSRAVGSSDSSSDYDIYIYVNKPIEEHKRRKILSKYCKYMEYSNHYWELEDDGILNNNVEIEFIYRTYDFLISNIENLVNGIVGHGYSTCFLDNLIKSKILVDKSGNLKELKDKYIHVLNRGMAFKIIQSNYPLIDGSMPALLGQISKAVKRKDLHSINHRISEFFAIYYDIIFAANLEPHPGEKRLFDNALLLHELPENFTENINAIFSSMFTNNITMVNAFEKLSLNLHVFLVKLNYIIE